MNFDIILDFLIKLQINNNRNWFTANKEAYEKAKAEFEQFITLMIPRLEALDESITGTKAKECIFRIFRDVRFSKNKEPYKTNFGAFIGPNGRKTSQAGYYIHLEPDTSFLGGGVYMPEAQNLKEIRTAIFKNPVEFKEILDNKNFKSYFPELYGEKLKRAPKDFSKDFPEIELLKNKHYVVSHNVANSFWTSPDLIENTMAIFKTQYAFNNFLNQALQSQ